MSTAGESRALPSAHPDPDRGPKRTVAAMVAVILLFVASAVAWAVVADLDVAVQGGGAVAAPSSLQEVQSLDGGIVEQMLVVAGDKVKKGQLLARLDTAQTTANMGESRHNQLAALAARARADALLSGKAPVFDDAWRQEAPELIDKENQLWRDSLREYNATRLAGQEAVASRRAELAEARARIPALQAAVGVGEQSFSIEERLFKEGAGARADYLAAQQRLMILKSDLDAVQQSLPRLSAGLAEAQAATNEALARARTQWSQQRSEFETRIATLQATLGGQRDRAARRDIFSPVDGTVNRVLVPTIGGVATPGEAILEIVPEEARLLMNVRVKPSDIGFVRPGQLAHVRIAAYDSATYGQLDAVVERVGADAIVDEKGEAYFELQLTAERDQLKLHGKALPITPGMPVDVGILTGQRSVMQYLLKPVLRGIQGALQER